MRLGGQDGVDFVGELHANIDGFGCEPAERVR
jgi:hypothetical protein